MTINVAFKSPDALVFATDGLACVFEQDSSEQDGKFLSNMAEVEKLVFLNDKRIITMFNGIGSLGEATLPAELRAIDARLLRKNRGRRLSTRKWANEVAKALWDRGFAERGTPPTPLHLVVGGFADDGAPEGPDGIPAPASPVLYEIKWISGMPLERKSHQRPQPVLAIERDGEIEHSYGAYYAGATAAVSRFVEGFDPELQQNLAVALTGTGSDGRPGILEELITLARARKGNTARASDDEPDDAKVQDMVFRFARRILREAYPVAPARKLAEHFSLQAAIDYTVFLAQCAYARENLSPTRHGPPRVGSTLQVACLERDRDAEPLARIRLDIRLQGYGSTPR
jgi:hypothetical protein